MERSDNLSFSVAATVLFVLAASVAAISGRLLHDGYSHYYRGIELLDMDRRDEAIVQLEDAARAYLPFSPFVDRALAKLTILAKSAQMRGDEEESRQIWEVIRRSILSSRHFLQPHKAELLLAESSLARLTAGAFPNVDSTAVVARPEDPHPWGSLLLVLGLTGWLVGSAAVIWMPRGGSGLASRRWAWLLCLGGLLTWSLMSLIL